MAFMIPSVLTGQLLKENMKTPLQIDNFLLELIAKQSELESKIEKGTKNKVGAFYTHKISTIDNIIAIVELKNLRTVLWPRDFSIKITRPGLSTIS